MSCLTPPIIRLPVRIQSLVGLASLLIRIGPIASDQPMHRPFGSLRSLSAGLSTSNKHQTRVPGHQRQTGNVSTDFVKGSWGSSSHQIGSQYMCGNSYSSMASSSPAVVQPTGTHTATVIFLHGLGDQGYGWAETFGMVKEPHIKYIFPHAGNMRVTLNMGMVMPSWFDIFSLGVGGKEDEKGIKKASDDLLQLIAEEECKGIPSNRIVVGGFSQGGAVALYAALTTDKPIAGVLGLSTWMPLFQTFKTEGIAKKSFPLLQCHGKVDQLLPFSLGQLTHKFLQTQVSNIEFRSFAELGHSSDMEEMTCVKEFLMKALP